MPLDRLRPPDFDTLWQAWMDRLFQKIDDWWERRQARRQTAPAQPPAPVPQPLTKADLKAMSQQELQAEKEKIFVEYTADPRFPNISNFTPEEKAEWNEDHKHHLYRFSDIETEMEARAAQEQAVRA